MRPTHDLEWSLAGGLMAFSSSGIVRIHSPDCAVDGGTIERNISLCAGKRLFLVLWKKARGPSEDRKRLPLARAESYEGVRIIAWPHPLIPS